MPVLFDSKYAIAVGKITKLVNSFYLRRLYRRVIKLSGMELKEKYNWDGSYSSIGSENSIMNIKDRIIRKIVEEMKEEINSDYEEEFQRDLQKGYDVYYSMDIIILYQDLVPGDTFIGFELYTTQIVNE